jgi:hypothetical protein
MLICSSSETEFCISFLIDHGQCRRCRGLVFCPFIEFFQPRKLIFLYSYKSFGAASLEDRVKEEITKNAHNGRLPCPLARQIARELSIPYGKVGEAADELGIKITDCGLGCF